MDNPTRIFSQSSGMPHQYGGRDVIYCTPLPESNRSPGHDSFSALVASVAISSEPMRMMLAALAGPQATAVGCT